MNLARDWQSFLGGGGVQDPAYLDYFSFTMKHFQTYNVQFVKTFGDIATN